MINDESLFSSFSSLSIHHSSLTTSSFSAIVPRDGRDLNVVFSGTIDGNRLTGTLSAGEFSTGFTGTRPGKGTAS